MYHQALSRKPDDPFCTEMLNRALSEAMSVKLTVSDHDRFNAFRSPRSEAGSDLDLRTPSNAASNAQSLFDNDFLRAVSTGRSGYRNHQIQGTSMAMEDGLNLSMTSNDVDMSTL